VSKRKKRGMTGGQTSARVDWLRIVSIVLCLGGIVAAGYLSYAELTGTVTQCSDAGKINCEAVQKSAYAETFGIPIAVFGLLGYVAILGVLVLEDQIDLLAAYGRTLVLGFAVFGVIFSVYLTLIEGLVLDAYCQWCVASAIFMGLLLVIVIYRVYAFLEPLHS
jgi:uncharacterized membrane protein